MGIRYHSGLAEDVAANQIGSFPADARQPGQLLDRIRYAPAVFVAQHLRHSHNIPCLGFIQAAGMDDFPDLLGIGLRKRLKGGVAAEQGRGDQIHSGIGALRGQARCNQQLQRVGIGKRTDGVGIALFQAIDSLQGNLLFSHDFSHPLWQSVNLQYINCFGIKSV